MRLDHAKLAAEILLWAEPLARDRLTAFWNAAARESGAGKALADLKGKGMQINELSPAETARMRDKLTAVNATIATNVGMDLWNETQAALAKLRGGK